MIRPAPVARTTTNMNALNNAARTRIIDVHSWNGTRGVEATLEYNQRHAFCETPLQIRDEREPCGAGSLSIACLHATEIAVNGTRDPPSQLSLVVGAEEQTFVRGI